MAIRELLRDMSAATFVEEYFLRLPMSVAGGAAEFQGHASWQTVERLWADPDADVLIVREGRRWAGTERPNFAEARELFHAGSTLLVRHTERHDAALKALAHSFAADFHAAVDVHVYCTPAAGFGFGWHYDAEDVFILQTSGVKEYTLRKNTVNPWPVAEALPADMRYGREIMPLLKCRLAAGDWLYIPNGYWHRAAAETDAISIAVGLMMPTALTYLDFARRKLCESLLWRQRLPVTGDAASLSREELQQRLAEVAAELGADLQHLLAQPALQAEFLDSLNPHRSS
jgi:ribosomal protein L16 Arg81 hydroxylase